eukprot:scaffold49132_cov32-Attheya_sp.AAC.1
MMGRPIVRLGYRRYYVCVVILLVLVLVSLPQKNPAARPLLPHHPHLSSPQPSRSDRIPMGGVTVA